MVSPYTGLRILGLISEKKLYAGDVNNGGTLKSRAAFNYDETGSIDGTDAPVQHDNTNYSATFVSGRGNVSSIQRFDVDNGQSITSSIMKYNTAGALVSSKDALNHEVKISYIDSFSDGVSRNTLAYPTKITDPDGYYSTSKYNFDFAAITSSKTPPPNFTGNPASQPVGPEQTSTYDDLGRLERTTSLVNNAYTRYQYPASKIRVDAFATLVAGLGEAHSFKISDGFGRGIATASDHPGSVGGFSAQRLVYDIMGRTIKTSNPTETNASGDNPSLWATSGDDAAAGWIYSSAKLRLEGSTAGHHEPQHHRQSRGNDDSRSELLRLWLRWG